MELTSIGSTALAEIILLLIVIVRKEWKGHAVFTVYIIWSILSDGAFFYLDVRHRNLSLTPYIIELTIDSILQFCVITEIAWSAIKPLRNALPKGFFLVVPVLLLGIGAFCWPFASLVVPDDLLPHGHLMLVLNQTVSILRIAFFVLLASFSQFFSIGWRDREMQIASGLGFYAAISLIVAMIHSHGMVGPQYHWLDLVTSFGYLGTLAYWVVCFSIKEPERKKISPQMQHFLVSIGGAARAERFALEAAVGQNRGKNSSQRRN